MTAALALAGLLAASGAAAAPFDLAGRSVVLDVHATGAQIYQCVASNGQPPAWSLREPIAALIKDGRTIGRHYAGPTWELDDGSLLTGRLAQTEPGPTPADIAQLKLDVVGRFGHGLLDQAAAIYRVHTSGGTLTGACKNPGELKAAPYAADYVFVK